MTTALPSLPTHGPLAAPVHAPATTRFTPLDPMRIFRQYAVVLMITAALGVGLGIAVYFVSLQWFPRYTTDSELKTSNGVIGAWDTPEDASGANKAQLEQIAAFITTQSYRLRTDDVLFEALGRKEVQDTVWFHSFYWPQWESLSQPEKQAFAQARSKERNATISEEDLAREIVATRLARAKEDLQLNGHLDSAQIRGSTLMRVTFQSPFAGREPRLILDTIINVYISRLRADNENRYDELRRVFVQQRDEAEQKQKRIYQQLDQFMVDYDLPSVNTQLHEAQISYQLLADQWTKLLITAQAARAAVDKLNTDEPADSPGIRLRVEQDPAVYQRNDKIRNLREQRAVAAERYGPEHRSVQDLDRTIEAVELERKRETDRLIREMQNLQLEEGRKSAESLEMQLKGIEPKLAAARRNMKDLSTKIQAYEHIADTAKAATKDREKADDLLNEIKVKGMRPDAVRVDRQRVAGEPELTFPFKWPLTIMGVSVLVLASVLGVIFLKEVLDQRVRYPGDLRVLPRAELLGVVPLASEDPSGTARLEGAVLRDTKGLMAEAFRQTRSNLVTRMDRRGYKTLMVTCARPQSGVSSVVSNLAVSLALNGRKVLVLDANLRRPAQHRLFDAPAEPGLVEVLQGAVPVEQALVHKTNPDVDVLPAGATRDVPPEVLESQAFRSLLSQMESRYDIILIDAPPALLASDCQMLAKQADAVAIVVRAMAEKRGMVGRLLRQFDGLRAENLGIILNGARSSAGGYFRENYQQFYRYRQGPVIKGLGAKKPLEAARK
jgi:polysaccharide biosynthesis transport protein